MARFPILSRAAVTIAVVAAPALALALDCDNAQTQQDMNQCAQIEWQAADEELNGAYAEAMAALKALDADLAKADRGAEEALRAAQRAWIAFRDNACLAESYAMFGGSAQPLLYNGCMARLTWARAGDLWLIVNQYR